MQRKALFFVAILVLALAGLALFSVIQSRKREAEVKSLKAQAGEKDAEMAAQVKAAEDKAKDDAIRVQNDALREKNLAAIRKPVVPVPEVKTNEPSALSAMTENPEMRKTLREQQKAGMKLIYTSFARDFNLTPEQTEKLNDLLADDVMQNVDEVTKLLRDGKTSAEIDATFAEREAAMNEKVKEALGQEGLERFQDYSHDLASRMTVEQFKKDLLGDDAEKEEHRKQLYQVMQEEAKAVIAEANLGSDFQLVPMLNFRNIASPEEADKNVALLDNIYDRVSRRAATFLTREEIGKFGEFRTNAININRMSLMMNRKMMSPSAK